MKDKTVGIYGIGLIGGSLGQALKLKGIKVIGIGRRPEVGPLAKELKAVDEYYTDIEKCINEIDILVLCVPVKKIVELGTGLISKLKEGTIITDVGSTKAYICKEFQNEIDKQKRKVYFIGSHPMAGSEKKGVKYADPLLFENAVCVLTPDYNIPEEIYNELEYMWKLTGANVIKLNYETHDWITAMISHIPHILAASVVNTLGDIPDFIEKALPLAAGSFRDITRVASSDPELWYEIIDTNKDKIVLLLERLMNQIGYVRQTIMLQDTDDIINFFSKAKGIRGLLPVKSKGIIGALYSLILSVPDKPGILAKITNVLSEKNINIKDIEILRVREGEQGSIKISFKNLSEREEALKILSVNNINARILDQ